MQRSYYSNSISNFLIDDPNHILGILTRNHTHALEELQRNAWLGQIRILKNQIKNFEGQVYFEFAIPRMGKRVDVIVIIKHIIFVIEFKVGDGTYGNHAIEQVIDYTLDLKNFHEGSHHTKLIPVLVSTNAKRVENSQIAIDDFLTAAKTNQNTLGDYIGTQLTQTSGTPINTVQWENSIYKPTPTIVEAAQALYKGHNVQEISRSDAGAINLSKTATCLSTIIEEAKRSSRKTICFVTGVPGAGKTLAGLNIANERMKSDEDEHAVFLSGNGPLVNVLREALTRDEVATAKLKGIHITKKEAQIKSNAFIQNIHHFRDDNLISEQAPIEKVVVFDEAQRAWNKEKASSFMKTKKGKEDFNKSEPEFLIEVMDRHSDWCTIICLIGGGQEINTGEAGLEEWISALQQSFANWDIHYSNQIIKNPLYIKNDSTRSWINSHGTSESDLHLAVSVRSFRSEKLSEFIHALLDLNKEKAKVIYDQLKSDYPIVLTRDLEIAKNWLRGNSKGSERIGLIASSEARRLKPYTLDVKNEIDAPNWFLNDKRDVRSSNFLEICASEFDIQGLEIDWACLGWGADFHLDAKNWQHQKFKGTKWQRINQETGRQYLKNAYRVLLTRARQGLVLFIPEGSKHDHTRPSMFYDETYNYLLDLGIEKLKSNAFKDHFYPREAPEQSFKKYKNKKQQELFTLPKLTFDMNDEIKKEKIGKFVKRRMLELIKNDLLTNEEIRNLQRPDYSKKELHLNYPLLRLALPTDPNNIPRYWAGKVTIRKKKYFICSEWYEQPTNNDRPYFIRWLRKISNDNRIQKSRLS